MTVTFLTFFGSNGLISNINRPISVAAWDSFVLQKAQSGCGAHADTQWVSGALYPGVKWLGCEVDHSNAEAKNVKDIPSLPHTSSWHSAQLGKHRDNLSCHAIPSWTPRQKRPSKNFIRHIIFEQTTTKAEFNKATPVQQRVARLDDDDSQGIQKAAEECGRGLI
jgi:hypothetical protein